MKEDTTYIIGGVALGLLTVYLVKQFLDSDKVEKSGDEEFAPPVQTAGIGSVSPPRVQYGAPTQVLEAHGLTFTPESQSQTTTSSVETTEEPIPVVPMPYDLNPINPQYVNTPTYDSLFGGCEFPIIDGSESVCVKRVQDAFDIDQTGIFDDATQQALDGFIEGIPSRNESEFAKFDREGCIDFDPVSNTTTNVCGLNHDQYLKILFQMGIPISQTYD